MLYFVAIFLSVAAGVIGFLTARSYYKEKMDEVCRELSRTIEVLKFLDALPVDRIKLIETEFITKQRELLEKVGSISSKAIAEQWKQYHNIFKEDCMNYPDVQSGFVQYIDNHKTKIVACNRSKCDISKLH